MPLPPCNPRQLAKPNSKVNYSVLRNVEPTTQLAAALLSEDTGVSEHQLLAPAGQSGWFAGAVASSNDHRDAQELTKRTQKRTGTLHLHPATQRSWGPSKRRRTKKPREQHNAQQHCPCTPWQLHDRCCKQAPRPAST